ncbi:MAG: hypothetical protein HC836_50430 [Richelia sp. RM2_1_2]|nr:hypothetical protein [Richelia sp. RM2_1_2]
MNNVTVFPQNSTINDGALVKFGIDPTGESLHLGHLVPLRIAKQFKNKNHPITIILGTGTAQLGDPSGKEKTRPIISLETCIKNADNIENKLNKF